MTGTVTQSLAARPPDATMPTRPARAVLASAVVTAAGALVWITWFPRVGTDLSAALARAGWAGRYPGSAYLFSWYGGFHPASYSLFGPYALALIGTRLAMALAAVAAAVLLTLLLVRHRAPRPRAAALWVAAAVLTELSAGRAAFTIGLAAGLGSVAVIDLSRPRRWPRLAAAAVLALLSCLLSPVAALFLCVVAVVFAVTRHFAEALAIAIPAALPLGVMAMFSDGGTQPFTAQNWLPPLLASAAVLALVPGRWRMVRIGALVYGLGVILTLAVPSLIGSNAARLAELVTGPLLAGMGTTRHRVALAIALVAAAGWQIAQPIADIAHGNAPPFAPATAALVRELGHLHADTARMEAVPQYGHWESQQLASVVPLARGWERQLDTERNPLFYRPVLTPDAYYRWLQHNAVRYVAISAGPLDPAATAEAQIIRAGQPWLRPVWHNSYWRLYLVVGSLPLASPPAAVVGTSPAQITVRITRPGTTLVRVHWSRLLRAPGAVVTQRGPWTAITVLRPGTYRLSAPY